MPLTPMDWTIEAVDAGEAQQVAAFIEHVVMTSVDASDTEKLAVGVVMVKAWWNLCHLFVAPQRQRQGVGRAQIGRAHV